MIVLAAENLVCVRGGRRVLNGMNFQFRGGEAVAITGPNGAGKTTLLRLAAGLLPLESGSLTLAGVSEERAASVHFAGHLDALKGALSVAENLEFSRAIAGGSGASVAEALEQLGIAQLAEFPARMLSAGQKRRLALARLLVTKRPVWLLDEPTSALDAASQQKLFSLIDAHTAGGGLALIATHAELALRSQRAFSIGGGA